MTRRLYLHAGTMKSGTSFLQNVLSTNKALLLEKEGLLFPGRRWQQQVNGIMEIIEHGGRGQPPMPADGKWVGVVADVLGHPGDSIISVEFLGPRLEGKIEQLLSYFPDHDVQVVFTVRDLARNIPAMWQESVQNGSTCTWPDFQVKVRDHKKRDEGPGAWFWKQQDLAGMMARWQRVVGNDHLTVVTVPPRGAEPGLLWRRFASVIGIDPDVCDTAVRANPSIGVASALLLRELNVKLAADGLPTEAYHQRVKHLLSKKGLAMREGEPTLGLDEDWVRRRGHEQVGRLRKLRLRVVGDLAELEPLPVAGVSTEDVTLRDQLDAALDGLAFMVHQWPASRARLQAQLQRQAGQAGQAQPGRAPQEGPTA